MAIEKFIFDQEIASVLSTWSRARSRSKDFDTDFGRVVLDRFFELQPQAKHFFGYEKSEEIGETNAIIHAAAFTCLFDLVFQMLTASDSEDDSSYLEEMLQEVGQRHKNQGVSPSFFPYMGEAFIYGIETFLGQKLSQQDQQLWKEVYDSMGKEIVKTIERQAQ